MHKKSQYVSKVYSFLRATAREYPKQLSLLIVLTILVGALEALGMGLLVPLIESIGVGNESGNFAWVRTSIEKIGLPFSLPSVLGFFFAIQLIRSITQYFHTTRVIYLQNLLLCDIRTTVFKKFMRSSWTHALGSDTGEHVNLLINEARQVGALFLNTCMLISQTLVILAYLAITFTLSPQLTLGIFLLVGISFFVLKPIYKKALDHGNSVVESRTALQSAANEHLANGKLIRSMNIVPWSISTFTNASRSVLDFTYRIGKGPPLVKLLFEPVAIGLLCGIIYTAVSILNTPFSSLAVMVLIFVRILPQISQIQEKAHAIVSLAPALDSIDKHSKAASEAKIRKGEKKLNSIQSQIEFENISFKYGEKSILSEISFSIPAKKTVAFIGSSGSGKTTIVDLIVGLLEPQEGDITYDSVTQKKLDYPSFRTRVGYVSQDTQMFNLSLRENLVLDAKDISDSEIWDALKLAKADDFVRQMEEQLETKVGDHGIRMSGGQRQRIALARALLRKPSLLILDEATSALDYDSESQIQSAIHYLSGKLTIVIIAHRLRTIKDADIIFQLDAGRIISQGSYSDLNLDKVEQIQSEQPK